MPDEAARLAGTPGSRRTASAKRARWVLFSGWSGVSAQARWLITARQAMPSRGSRRQLATIAPRSISRMAPARAAGSEDIGKFYRHSAARSEGSIRAVGQALGADEIIEFGRLGLEMQFDRADRPMALLGDDDL